MSSSGLSEDDAIKTIVRATIQKNIHGASLGLGLTKSHKNRSFQTSTGYSFDICAYSIFIIIFSLGSCHCKSSEHRKIVCPEYLFEGNLARLLETNR